VQGFASSQLTALRPEQTPAWQVPVEHRPAAQVVPSAFGTALQPFGGPQMSSVQGLSSLQGKV
jgi:hypothetical protein